MSTFFYEPFYDIDRLVNEVLLPRVTAHTHSSDRQLQHTSGDRGTFKPKMDLHEDPESNMVTAVIELPGIRKEDTSIDVHDGRLTVSGEGKTSTERNEDGYAIRERRYGKYSRTIQLPQGVKPEEVKASMDSGLLTVTFPKTTPDQAPKRITIG